VRLRIRLGVLFNRGDVRQATQRTDVHKAVVVERQHGVRGVNCAQVDGRLRGSQDAWLVEDRCGRADGPDRRGHLVVERGQLLSLEERAAKDGWVDLVARFGFLHDLDAEHVRVAVEGIRNVFHHLRVIVLQPPTPLRSVAFAQN